MKDTIIEFVMWALFVFSSYRLYDSIWGIGPKVKNAKDKYKLLCAVIRNAKLVRISIKKKVFKNATILSCYENLHLQDMHVEYEYPCTDSYGRKNKNKMTVLFSEIDWCAVE